VFVELEPGIDGLVHISDLSWTKKIRHPGEVVKKGDKIEVVVLGVDTDSRKISLGHKQINENPWENFEKEYAVGKKAEGKIVRIIEKGLIAELSLGVDGFLPATQLSTAKIKNLSFCFPIGTKLEMKVVEFDKENKKIVLSALGALKEKSDEEIAQYITDFKLEKVTVADVRAADAGKFDSSDFNLYEDSKPQPLRDTAAQPADSDKKE
jgi:small subunit ribosomal protein S1